MAKTIGIVTAAIFVAFIGFRLFVEPASQAPRSSSKDPPDLGEAHADAMNSCIETFGYEGNDFGGQKANRRCESSCPRETNDKAKLACYVACDDQMEEFSQCVADRTARRMNWPLEKRHRIY